MPLEAQLVLALLFGLAGWQHARRLEKKYGSRAWGMDAWLWGVITGLSLLIGVILMAVAERALKKAPIPAQPGYAPAYPLVPAQATAPVEAVSVEAPPAPVAAVPAPAAPAAPPAGWHPDPSGKFDHRWWDGQRWTANVSTNGVAGTDA